MGDRVILHSDINSCYASIELLHHPELRGKPLAVGGDPEARHGIVLTADYVAKKHGVKTGMALWQARQVCPDITFVPPRMDLYLRFSKMAHEIYGEYTDLQEPYGIDESWLDVTASASIKGDGYKIAHEISNRMKSELGITVSVGVSFNKIFAKLGSDYKKPDAITTMYKDEFQTKAWNLLASDLLYVGRSTDSKLRKMGIRTIGDIARADEKWLNSSLGKMGSILWALVTKERVRTFNSISNAGYEIISIIGPLIGLLLVDNVGVQWALYFDGFTFLISAMIESFFRPFYAKTVTNKKFKKEFMKGFYYIKNKKEILSLIIISSVVNFMLAGYNLFIPYTENIYKSVCNFFYSKVLIAEAIGGIIGAYVVGKTKNKKIEIWLLILGIGLSIVFIPLFKLIPIVLFKLIPFSLCGIVATMYNVSYISTLQEMVALDFQGRIFGIIQALVTIFMPIGALTFSLLPIKCESFYAIGTLMVVVSVISSILMKKTNIKIYQ